MFSEWIHNGAKMFELFTGTLNAIAIGLIAETGALRSTGSRSGSYRQSVHQLTPEAQREWAMANARIVSLNR